MKGQEETVTTENEIARRVAKVEELVAGHQDAHNKLEAMLRDMFRKNDPLDHLTPVIAIVCLSALEGIAIYRHEDGTMFMPIVAAIAALAGVKLGDTVRDIFGGKKK